MVLYDSETHIRDLTKVSIPTLVNLFIIFRQVCSQFLQAHPIELGGPGAVLQIVDT